MRNNRKKIINKSINDYLYNKIEVAQNEAETKSKTDEIKEMFEKVFRPREYTVYGKNDVLESKLQFRKQNTSGNRKEIDNSLNLLNKKGFFDVITGTAQNGSALIKKTVEMNNYFNYSKQVVKSNASLASVKEVYSNLQELKANGGKLHIYDLETIGGTNRNNVWSPIGITEFSVHTKDFSTGQINKTDVFLGLEKKKALELQEKIFKAIDNGTLEDDGDLAVTAMRISMYGNEKTKIRKNAQGVYEVVSFVSGEEAKRTNKELIKKGFKKLVYAYENTDTINGLNAAEKVMLDKMSEIQKDLATGNAMLGGFNHTIFDNPIYNKFLQDIQIKYKDNFINAISDQEKEQAKEALKYFSKIFDLDNGGQAVLSPTRGQNADMRAFVDLFKGYYGVDAVYGGNKDSYVNIGPRMLRQEHIAEAHFKTKMQTGNAHQASFDVEMLTELFLGDSELLKTNFLDYIMNGKDGKSGLNAIKEPERKLDINNQLFKAKNTSVSTSFSGQGHLNFVYDRKNNNIYTADGYEISKNGVEYFGFDLGAKINKGQMYTISGINKLDTSTEWGEMMAKNFPELASQNIFALTMDIQVPEEYNSTVLGNTSRIFLFKSESELEAFVSSNFNLIAERGEDGKFKILRDNKDVKKELEIRKLQKNKDGSVGMIMQKDYWDLSDEEILEKNLKLNVEKILSSRAEGSIMGDNSYKKIKQLLSVQNAVEDKIGNITGLELSQILSNQITSNEILGKIDEKGISTLQEQVIKLAGYNGKLHETTKTSLSISYDYIQQQSDALNVIIGELEKNNNFNSASKQGKQIIFDNVLRSLKMQHAENYYQNNAEKIRDAILNNREALMSTKDIMDYFEFDIKGFSIKDQNEIIDISKPNQTKNLLRVNISQGKEYELINKLIKAKYDDEIPDHKKDTYAIDVLNDFMKRVKAQIPSEGKESPYYNGIRSLINEMEEVREKKTQINPYEFTTRLLSSLREVKSLSPTAGIINTKTTMSALIHNDKNLIKDFNNFVNADNVKDAINNAPNFINFKDEKEIQEYVSEKLIKYYMPDKDKFLKKHKGKNDIQKRLLENLYNTTRAGHIKNLTNIITVATSVNANVSVQNDGTLVLSKDGKFVPLDRVAKTKMHDESGVLYNQIGMQKIVANSKVSIKNKGRTPEIALTSNIEDVNKSMGNVLKRMRLKYENGDFDLNDLEYSQTTISKKLLANSTLQSFSIHDNKSNLRLETDDIKNILYDLFAQNGTLRNKMELIDSKGGFRDRNLIKTMEKLIGDNQTIEELSPAMKHNLSKNIQDILLSLVGHDDPLLREVLQKSNASSKENQTSDLVFHVGDRYKGSAATSFDNNARPVIAQSGRGYFLRTSDIDNAAKEINPNQILFKGTLFNSKYSISDSVRNVEGIGKATTKVSFKRRFVGSAALKAILDNNFEDVIKNAKVENLTQEKIKVLYAQLYDSINTFEQEKHMDSRVFENVFGRPADIQRLSNGSDIIKPLSSSAKLSKEEIESYEKLLDMIGNVSLDENGDLKYTKDVGKFVKKGDKLVKYSSFGSEKNWTSKMDKGILNYGFFSETSNIQLNEEEITKIINENKSLFLDKDNNLLNKVELKSNLIKLFEDKNFVSQYFIEDINRIGYAKIMDDDVEKGMTKIDYVKLGNINENVAEFFNLIGRNDLVGTTVLTDNAFNTIIAESDNVKSALSKSGFKNLDALKKSIYAERHAKSVLTYDYIFKGATEIANDALAKHGNKGSMMLGLFSELAISTSKYLGVDFNDEGRDKTLNFIFDYMNRDSSYSFLKTMDINKMRSTGNYVPESIKLQSEKGLIKIYEKGKNGVQVFGDFSTALNSFSAIDNVALEKLITDMNKEYGWSDNDELNLVHEGVDLVSGFKNGKYIINRNQTYIGRGYFQEMKLEDPDGKTMTYKKVLTSTESLVGASMMQDSETQTGVSQAYFDKKMEIIKAKKEYARTGQVEYLTKAIKLEEELAPFKDVVKQMKITDQELSIMEMYALNEASDTVLNKLKGTGFEDEFSDMINVQQDGSLALKDPYKNKKLLGNITEQYKSLVLYNYLDELELTEDMVNSEEYSHLKTQYDTAHLKGRKIGVDTAQKFYNLERANMAYEFDRANGLLRDIEYLEKEGFNKINIKDFISNYGKKSDIIDSIANKHLLIDMGADFDISSEYGTARYIALPGLGSLIGDSEVKTNYQSKLMSLSNDVTKYYQNLEKRSEEDLDALKNNITRKVEDIKQMVTDIYKKNGVMHEASKVYSPTPSYRLKASGANGYFANAELSKKDMLDMWGINDQRAMATAEINGKSLLDWEKEGTFFDYKFISKSKFKELGYYDKNYMEKLGIETEEEMTDFLKKHGALDITSRYPNIISTSMVTTRLFLDENNLADNQTKVSRVTTLKYNGDFDGDSSSSTLLKIQTVDTNGEYVFEDYGQYIRARNLAKEALGEDATQEEIRKYATTSSKVKISEKAYDEFRSIDYKMALDANDINVTYAKEVESIMASDVIKTAKNLSVKNIAEVEGGQSILGRMKFTQLSEVIGLDEFNKNEEIVNLRLKELYGEDANVRDFNNVGKGLDQALVDYEKGVKEGKFSEKAFKQFEAEAVLRYRIQKYDEEVMSKGAKGIIGAANVSLNATKLAANSIFGGDGPDRDIFRAQMIWQVNYLKEQDPISGKKLTLNYDENRIDNYADISRRLFSAARNDSSKIQENKIEMANWMDNYIGKKEAFASFYDENLGKFISDSTHKNVMRNVDMNNAEEVMMKKYSYIRDEYLNAIVDLGKNKMAQSYLDLYGSLGKSGDKFLKRSNAMMASSMQDTLSGIANSQFKPLGIEDAAKEAELFESKREAQKFILDKKENIIPSKSAMSSSSNDILSIVSSMSSKGLGMAALGMAAGIMAIGFASGNPLNEANPETVTQTNNDANRPQSIPQFLDEQGGYVTGNSKRGYIINIKADTQKGKKHMEKAMKEAAKASVGGSVSVNMNIRNTSGKMITDKDIEDYIEFHLQ